MEGSEDHLSATPFLKTMSTLVSLNNFAKFERLVIMYIRIKDYHLCKAYLLEGEQIEVVFGKRLYKQWYVFS
jgi:hypothetical protein